MSKNPPELDLDQMLLENTKLEAERNKQNNNKSKILKIEFKKPVLILKNSNHFGEEKIEFSCF